MSRPNKRLPAALDLMRSAKEGPSLPLVTFGIPGLKLTTGELRQIEVYFIEHYRLWADSWIIPRLRMLVPELREDPDGEV